jgi:NAD(P) transhydrogenase subunit alpha
MENNKLVEQAAGIASSAENLSHRAAELALQVSQMSSAGAEGAPFFVMGLTVFVLACFVGYYVVWRVTPALHSPLMAVTNAISSVIIVGALIAAGPSAMSFSKWMGFFAVILASVNIFGGFIVTQRMLAMFSRKKKQEVKKS